MEQGKMTLKNLIVKNPFEQSPTVPERMCWSYSTLKLFRKCQRKFFWQRMFRIRSRYEAPPLVVSNASHEGLATWYSLKRTTMSRIAVNLITTTMAHLEKNVKFYQQDEYDDLLRLISAIRGMLIGYSKVYRDDKKKWSLTKRDVEVWFNIDMGDFDFVGKIDLMPTQKKKLLLVDHKVISNIGESYLEKLSLDGQMRGYILGANSLGLKPKRVVYNLIRKCKLRKKSGEGLEEFCKRIEQDYLDRPDFYFQREELRFSKADVEAFEHDLRKTHEQYDHIITSAADPLDPWEWPCNDDACDDYHRTCEFFPLCIQGLDIGTSKLYTQRNSKKHRS